ncbi:MAG: four-carbon acid sugar kinase family protein, partial [Lewinella sp.]
MDLPVLDFAETMAALPPQQPADGLDEAIRLALADRYDVVIVLDDDPTGTQTVHEIPVITEWTVEAISAELKRKSRLFFLLTNSRALKITAVENLIERIGRNIRTACDQLDLNFITILRGDSTLRGHFGVEEGALHYGTGFEHVPDFLIPAFFEGGRYTINDIHYVKEGEKLIPAGQSPFAKDSSFGYQSSNLNAWVEEKTGGGIMAGDVISISLADLREEAPLKLKRKLENLPPEAQLIVNAADYIDLKRVALAILRFAKYPQLRTSASFIKALLGQPDRPKLKLKAQQQGRGGLFIVGSHVPKTTAQLRHLQQHHKLVEFEVDVKAVVLQVPEFAQEMKMRSMAAALTRNIAEALQNGQHVLVYTSREVIKVDGAAANLNIAAAVSGYLETVVANLPEAPSFLLTKGGITSSRIATEALGVKRAIALGQVQPGVPTWELGPESKFPGMPFIIFPGNVGADNSLSLILENTII